MSFDLGSCCQLNDALESLHSQMCQGVATLACQSDAARLLVLPVWAASNALGVASVVALLAEMHFKGLVNFLGAPFATAHKVEVSCFL